MITFLILIFVGFGNAQLRYRPQEKYDYLTIFKDDQWEKVKCECNAPEFYVSCEDESILQPMLETDYFCFGMTCHYQIIFDPNCPDTYFTVFADYTFQKSKNILSISENPEYGPFFFPSRLIFSPMAKLFVRFDSLNMPHYDHQNKWKITFNPRPAPKKVQINLDLKNPYHLLWIDSMKSDEMITVCLADNNEAQKMEMKLQRRNDLSLIKFYNSNDMTQFVSSLNFEPEMSESTNVFTNSCFTLHQWFKPEPATKSFVLFKLFFENHLIEMNGKINFKTTSNESRKITILSSNNPSLKDLPKVCIAKFEATIPDSKYVFKNGFTGAPLLMLNGSVAEQRTNYIFFTPALDIYIPPMAQMTIFVETECERNASTFYRNDSSTDKNETKTLTDISVYYELKNGPISAANFVNLSTILLFFVFFF